MQDVKAKAVEQMTPLLENLPAKQIELSLGNNVDEWLVPGLSRLVQREEPLDKNDVDLIGLENALKVMALREDCRNTRDGWIIQRRGATSLDVSKEVRIRFNIRQ